MDIKTVEQLEKKLGIQLIHKQLWERIQMIKTTMEQTHKEVEYLYNSYFEENIK